MMIETLNAWRIDYPRYEVVVVDNNTKDPKCGSRWKSTVGNWCPFPLFS